MTDSLRPDRIEGGGGPALATQRLAIIARALFHLVESHYPQRTLKNGRTVAKSPAQQRAEEAVAESWLTSLADDLYLGSYQQVRTWLYSCAARYGCLKIDGSEPVAPRRVSMEEARNLITMAVQEMTSA